MIEDVEVPQIAGVDDIPLCRVELYGVLAFESAFVLDPLQLVPADPTAQIQPADGEPQRSAIAERSSAVGAGLPHTDGDFAER